MENTHLNDFQTICRTCMYNHDLKPIQDQIVIQVLHNSTHINFVKDEELPQQICDTCITKTNQIHAFKLQCNSINETLKQCLIDYKTNKRSILYESIMIKQEETDDIKYNDFKTICRTCLIKNDLQPIQNKLIIEVLLNITGINYLKDDELPEQICVTCVTKLNDINLFILQCNSIDLALKKRLNDLKSGILFEPILIKEEPKMIDDISETCVKPEIYHKHFLDNFDETIYNDVTQHFLNNTANTEQPISDNETDSCHTKNKRRKKQTKTIFQCETCNKTFARKRNLLDHGKIHTGEKDFKCDLCPRAFFQLSSLVKHKKLHNGERPFKCDMCAKTFPLFNQLKRHKVVHSRVCPYKCDMCRKEFKDASTLRKHRVIHSVERPHKCDTCFKTFKDSGNLIRHRRVHSGERPYQCNVCPKTFIQSSHLIIHKRMHSGERPYNCDVCAKTFIDSSTLRKHKKVHGGEKKVYKCNVCNKEVNDSSNLRKHKRIHSGEKPYQCNVCLKAFSQSSDLRAHERSHSGERPFKCDVCCKGFARSISLKKHKNTNCCVKSE